MRKGIELIGKGDEAWVPSSVFGSDARSAGCAYGGGTVGAVVGGGRHENRAGVASLDFQRVRGNGFLG